MKVKIMGKVQGIGFRWSAYEKFVELGLSGKAENNRDGSVDIDVTGEEFSLNKFVEWARIGPPGARVSNLEMSAVVDKPLSDDENKPSISNS